MTDRPEASDSELATNIAREALLAAVQGKSYIARRGIELASSALLPTLAFLQTDSLTENQRLAINTYEQMPGFSTLGDESRFPSNTRALALARQNITLDRGGARTINEDGRMVAVRLPNPADSSHLSASLIFPFGYTGAERTMGRLNLSWSSAARESTRALADYYREGHRLAMKKDGFEVTEGGVRRLARAGLTPGEQLKLDCLTFKALTAKKSLGETLSPFEQQALTEVVGRLNRDLAADNPDEFVRKWKNALALCRSDSDRRVFQMGVAGLLSDENNGRQLIDSFERWFDTNRYKSPLQNWLRDKDSAALRQWVQTNDPQNLASFPRTNNEREVETWVRRRYAQTFADQWQRAMNDLGNDQDKAAFQSFVNLALGQRERAGTLAGLFEALNDPRNRPEGDRTKPVDAKKAAEKIIAAATDPAGKSSTPRPPGQFNPEELGLPPESKPSWWQQGLGLICAGGVALTVGAVVYGAARIQLLRAGNAFSVVRDDARSLYRWLRGTGTPSAPLPEVTEQVAKEQVSRFWERVRGSITPMGENTREGTAGSPRFRQDLLRDALEASKREGALHAQAEAHINRLIEHAGTSSPPEELTRALRTPPPAAASAETGSVVRVDAPLRLGDVANAAASTESGRGLKIELTIAGRCYTLEDEREARRCLDETKEGYERRVAQLERMDTSERSPAEERELRYLRDSRASGWGAEDLAARARFLQSELDAGRVRFEPSGPGRPGIGRFAIGASLLFLALGAWAISEAPRGGRPPTRAERH